VRRPVGHRFPQGYGTARLVLFRTRPLAPSRAPRYRVCGMPTLERKSKPRDYVRRSRRFALHIPVVVYGRTPDDRPFRDHTSTINVDAHGARIAVAASLEKGQRILVVNSFTQEERECRVVHIGAKQAGRTRIGIEFLKPSGNFWHIYSVNVESKLQPANVV